MEQMLSRLTEGARMPLSVWRLGPKAIGENTGKVSCKNRSTGVGPKTSLFLMTTLCLVGGLKTKYAEAPSC